MRLRPHYTPPGDPTPVPGDSTRTPGDGCFRVDGNLGCDPDAESDADVYRRFVFSAKVLGWSLVMLFSIGLTAAVWLRVAAGH